MNPIETLLAFFDAINRHDPQRLAALMTEDHIFFDSLGRSVHGREAMRAGWQGYFSMCPDYRVEQEAMFESGDAVAAFGLAGGTIREHQWTTPAAWRAVIRDGRIQEFRVYADNKPVYDILSAAA
jgi:ketosteroid isomerase-like protein